jgi:hypothetical protein
MEGPHWCDKHAELFRQNGADPQKVLDQVVKAYSVIWRNRRPGPQAMTDEEAIKVFLTKIKGEPFCCWMGDEKLKNILVRVSTNVEKMKEQYRVDDGN